MSLLQKQSVFNGPIAGGYQFWRCKKKYHLKGLTDSEFYFFRF